jgi:hypothetical protein
VATSKDISGQEALVETSVKLARVMKPLTNIQDTEGIIGRLGVGSTAGVFSQKQFPQQQAIEGRTQKLWVSDYYGICDGHQGYCTN